MTTGAHAVNLCGPADRVLPLAPVVASRSRTKSADARRRRPGVVAAALLLVLLAAGSLLSLSHVHDRGSVVDPACAVCAAGPSLRAAITPPGIVHAPALIVRARAEAECEARSVIDVPLCALSRAPPIAATAIPATAPAAAVSRA